MTPRVGVRFPARRIRGRVIGSVLALARRRRPLAGAPDRFGDEGPVLADPDGGFPFEWPETLPGRPEAEPMSGPENKG